MTLHIYNTESREKEPITLAPHKKEIALYTCGPTVYNFAHIGNFRTYVFEDLFRRTLEFFGLKVKQVMNLTDVDDKTIKGALEKGVSLDEFTQFYKRAFFEDLKTLGIQKAHLYPSAIDYIPQMIAMIQHLIKKGLAYKGKEGSVYFSIRHFPAYGKLSHLCLSELKAGASERVTTDEYEKESIADFVLWKGYDPERDGDIYWESPFGKGRPGWHIECSAMATELLGETIDIHMGGVDNIFPHHENEIAQSEGCSGKMFSRYWVHAEHLIVNGKKMSKSLGNFFTLRDLLDKGYSGTEVRYLLLSTHYRTQLNFTLEGLNAARQSLQRLEDFVHRLKQVQKGKRASAQIKETKDRFNAALADDLNISVALAALFDFIRHVNGDIDRNELSKEGASQVLAFLKEIDHVLGVIPLKEREEEIPKDIQEAFTRRQEARAKKNWADADKERDYIQSKGYLIEDSPTGSRVKKNIM
ncbi:cysteine--tRNA ligase [Simkania negevensis]|uniref:Cysteine--tRNA ligase n=1 Tax=Simkania negevensis (strain ATCC VR-1471 / DSM 27360 / Z) TaxID=331113 RepID=F8L9P0_SIMNZ|nr:cysteine--tRNA ligase [Simkania negevensis]CCB89577.1 cysteinyl-tRNA synthetase [Simkania negevensis Z]